jgi:hypothetical protein
MLFKVNSRNDEFPGSSASAEPALTAEQKKTRALRSRLSGLFLFRLLLIVYLFRTERRLAQGIIPLSAVTMIAIRGPARSAKL